MVSVLACIFSTVVRARAGEIRGDEPRRISFASSAIINLGGDDDHPGESESRLCLDAGLVCGWPRLDPADAFPYNGCQCLSASGIDPEGKPWSILLLVVLPHGVPGTGPVNADGKPPVMASPEGGYSMGASGRITIGQRVLETTGVAANDFSLRQATYTGAFAVLNGLGSGTVSWQIPFTDPNSPTFPYSTKPGILVLDGRAFGR